MARTKASVGAKVTCGKSSKVQKSNPQPTASSSSGRSKSVVKPNWSGGNSYCPRETPNWQQPITRFFKDNVNSEKNGEASGSSHSRKRVNVITSDTESDEEINTNKDKPSESFCEDSIVEESFNRTITNESDLEPLVEDESLHKIGEYFKTLDSNSMQTNINNDDSKKTLKNKGTGKSSKNRSSISPDKENCEPMNVTENEVTSESVKKRMLDDSINENIEKEVKKIKI